MTEKRYTPSGRWIKDNYIDKLLNIDFNTITDMNLCCNLLNQCEDEKERNGKIATKYFEENEQLKTQIKIFELFLDGNNLDIEWDLFCTKEDGCPFTDASCQECIYLGINGDVE